MDKQKRHIQKLMVLQQALIRLQDAVTEAKESPESDTLRDGVIQRFEFSFELAWKALKAKLEHEGFSNISSPRATFKLAHQAGWLENETAWISLLDDRNQTSHTYDAASALAIYERIVAHHLPLLQALAKHFGPIS